LIVDSRQSTQTKTKAETGEFFIKFAGAMQQRLGEQQRRERTLEPGAGGVGPGTGLGAGPAASDAPRAGEAAKAEGSGGGAGGAGVGGGDRVGVGGGLGKGLDVAAGDAGPVSAAASAPAPVPPPAAPAASSHLGLLPWLLLALLLLLNYRAQTQSLAQGDKVTRDTGTPTWFTFEARLIAEHMQIIAELAASRSLLCEIAASLPSPTSAALSGQCRV
jgi:hypothetical protein